MSEPAIAQEEHVGRAFSPRVRLFLVTEQLEELAKESSEARNEVERWREIIEQTHSAVYGSKTAVKRDVAAAYGVTVPQIYLRLAAWRRTHHYSAFIDRRKHPVPLVDIPRRAFLGFWLGLYEEHQREAQRKPAAAARVRSSASPIV